jgi:hypothetical protein
LVMAFIPPEIGFRVKNRFTYSEIQTFQPVLTSWIDLNPENLLNFSVREWQVEQSLAVPRG